MSVGSFSLYSEISFQKSDSSAHRGQKSSFDLQGPDASQRRSSSGESIWWQQRSRSDHITQCLSLLCCLRIGDRSEWQPSLKCAFLDFDGHIESGLKKRQTSQILTVSLQLQNLRLSSLFEQFEIRKWSRFACFHVDCCTVSNTDSRAILILVLEFCSLTKITANSINLPLFVETYCHSYNT